MSTNTFSGILSSFTHLNPLTPSCEPGMFLKFARLWHCISIFFPYIFIFPLLNTPEQLCPSAVCFVSDTMKESEKQLRREAEDTLVSAPRSYMAAQSNHKAAEALRMSYIYISLRRGVRGVLWQPGDRRL